MDYLRLSIDEAHFSGSMVLKAISGNPGGGLGTVVPSVSDFRVYGLGLKIEGLGLRV